MTRRAYLALAPLGLGLVLSVYACGSSDSANFTGADDGGVADGTTGDALASGDGGAGDGAATSTDGAAGDGSATGDANGLDAGPGVDAAIDGAIPDGGVAPAPHKIACGAIECTLPATCCLQPDGGGTCGGGCGTGVQRECDEAADCPQAPTRQVCCYEITPAGLTASCHGDCGGGGGNRVQACRVVGECLSGSCAVHSCVDGGSVETCNPVPNICP
jgi:hypothetical protein